MDKISSILPNNARVKTVDLAESHPIRPGTPSFGRPVGANRLGDRVTLSQQALRETTRESALDQAKVGTLNDGKNPRDAKNVKIADQLTNQFFMKRLEPIQEVKGESLSEEVADLNASIGPQAQTEVLPEPEASEPAKSLSVYA